MPSSSSTAHRINALLFDVEGVIAHPDEAALDAMLAAFSPGLSAERLRKARNTDENYALWETYSCGQLDRDGYWAPILSTLGIEATPMAIRAVHAAQRDTWWADLSHSVLELARVARRSMPIGLLSNSAPEHEAHIPRFAGQFDVNCFSHRMGLRKPNASAYMEASRRFGIKPEAIVFIDDKLRNVDAARKVGMHAVHFTDTPALAAELSALGVAVTSTESAL